MKPYQPDPKKSAGRKKYLEKPENLEKMRRATQGFRNNYPNAFPRKTP